MRSIIRNFRVTIVYTGLLSGDSSYTRMALCFVDSTIHHTILRGSSWTFCSFVAFFPSSFPFFGPLSTSSSSFPPTSPYPLLFLLYRKKSPSKSQFCPSSAREHETVFLSFPLSLTLPPQSLVYLEDFFEGNSVPVLFLDHIVREHAFLLLYRWFICDMISANFHAIFSFSFLFPNTTITPNRKNVVFIRFFFFIISPTATAIFHSSPTSQFFMCSLGDS